MQGLFYVLTFSFLFIQCSERIANEGQFNMVDESRNSAQPMPAEAPAFLEEPEIPNNSEEYATVRENEFQNALEKPLSTFSIDVDKAAYSNMRRFINMGQLPPANAVRVEEFINYFNYEYPEPKKDYPFSITTEMSDCPWQAEHKLLRVGLKGQHFDKYEMPPSNLVFLLDVSGSMNQYNKLPLLKSAFKLLTQQLRDEDRVSIVVYAGASGVVLSPTAGSNQRKIMEALDQLEAGGSTAGAEGIELAYRLAKEAFIKGGNNRVILATDGDFNVGISSDRGLEKLIEAKRKEGVFLTVLGFGMGNYKDSKMEILADKGNGNYAYIDNLKEAKKVLVDEITGTLFTIAKDVKIQVDFNPGHVKSYRLIGYENRILKTEDFEDDTKDAGEIGAGHMVTALYEIVPINSKNNTIENTSGSRYQNAVIREIVSDNPEWMTIKLRYKKPDLDLSEYLEVPVVNTDLNFVETSADFKFAASVAGFGMLLSNSKFKGNTSFDLVEKLAKEGSGKDKFGYRAEFIDLVDLAKALSESLTAQR